jgi:signal transduction histidine kinase
LPSGGKANAERSVFMNRNKTFSISGVILTAAAGVLPWLTVIFAPVWPVMAVCAVGTVLAALSIVLGLHDHTKRNRALEAQILQLQSVLETDEQGFATAEEGLEQLAAAAAEQQAVRCEVQRTNGLFMAEWHGKMQELLAEADLRTGKVAKDNENYYPLRKLAHNLRGLTEDIRQAVDCGENHVVEYDVRYIRPVALDRLANRMLLNVVPVIRNRKLHVERTIQRLKVQTDPVLLARVLEELMDNAVRYTPDNGTIKVSVLENNGMAELVISDAGHGIAPEEMVRIFQRGTAADNELPTRPGMGLYLVRSYCHLLGHTVELRSDGQGTQAVLRMKLTAEAEKAEDAAEAAAEEAAAEAPAEASEEK